MGRHHRFSYIPTVILRGHYCGLPTPLLGAAPALSPVPVPELSGVIWLFEPPELLVEPPLPAVSPLPGSVPFPVFPLVPLVVFPVPVPLPEVVPLRGVSDEVQVFGWLIARIENHRMWH